jgi:predicted RNase H-like HicB family nuclease
MKRRVIVYQDETGGWCVLCLSPGAFSQGENREDVLANIRELLPGWIEEEFKNQPIPGDDGHIEIIEISLERHKT